MESNPQKRFKCGFKVKKKLHMELIKHQDGHYYIYLNGMLTDVLVPRSVENDGGIKWPTSLKELWDIKNTIHYGYSKYNEEFIRDLLDDNNFLEYMV